MLSYLQFYRKKICKKHPKLNNKKERRSLQAKRKSKSLGVVLEYQPTPQISILALQIHLLAKEKSINLDQQHK
jgi:hypothetical protein